MKKLISNYFKPWYEKWEETMQTFPENKWFLQHDYIIKANEILMLDQEPLNLQGGYLRGAGGFILKDDVNWGSQIYQSCWIG